MKAPTEKEVRLAFDELQDVSKSTHLKGRGHETEEEGERCEVCIFSRAIHSNPAFIAIVTTNLMADAGLPGMLLLPLVMDLCSFVFMLGNKVGLKQATEELLRIEKEGS